MFKNRQLLDLKSKAKWEQRNCKKGIKKDFYQKKKPMLTKLARTKLATELLAYELLIRLRSIPITLCNVQFSVISLHTLLYVK